ncbi:MAG: aminopeptidase [bacterium]
MKISLALVCCLLLSGCDLSYYWQATRGHLDLLQRKQEIQSLLLDNTTDPELKKNSNFFRMFVNSLRLN